MQQAFDLCFAGLVEQQNETSLDPSGRTDLLILIDKAQADGSISWRFGEEFDSKSHRLTLHRFHVEVSRLSGEVELRVPLHLIASVCYILEQEQHVICVSIAPDESLPQRRDVALLLLNSKTAADEICETLAQRFQAVYREAATMNLGNPKIRLRGSALSSPASRQLSARLPALASAAKTATSMYTSSDASTDDYIAQLSAGFSDNELHELITLLQRYQQGSLPLLEYLHKLKELHGPHRQHLLTRHLNTVRPEDAAELQDFLRLHNISDGSASVSSSVPIWQVPPPSYMKIRREETECPDSPGNMSSSARPSSGSGGGIRSFLSRLRKPSDQMFGSVQIGTRTYDANELQKLIPQLEDTISKKDQQLKQVQMQNDLCTKRITELETEVRTLQRECDKLRSVLDQKATSAASPGGPSSPGPRTEQLGNDLAQKAVVGNDTANQRSKKLAVSAEPTNFEQTKSASLQHHSKTAGSKQLIRDAVQKNDFLKQLAKEQIIELVECMYEMRARAGQWVIQEGEPGDRLFVVAEGELQVSREGQSLGTMRAGTVMGELAILYNCTRTASVQAITDVQLWVLDRSVFQMITQRLGMERHSQLMSFLSKVSIFENLTEDRISKIADVLDQDYYAGGHHIIRQGEKGDAFFIINSGQVKVTQLIEGETEPREIRVLGQGDFFGERALLGEEVRTANIIAQAPGVEVLTLDRDSFLKLIGDLEALKRDYGDKERLATVIHEPPSPVKEDIRAEFESVKLTQIKRLATLGVGGFGRVELVCINGDKSRTFALKALKKKHIVDTRQQEHIFAERNIMMETSSDWIVKLFKTFRDTKYVYMLLEVCLGGELWTTLRDRGHFDDYTARFFVACVLEGLEYLHRKNIVYRDLKPENCLLTNTGYLKLVDFGFAKKLASGRKTWTFCGTPEYVSPEIILNKGHDQAADYWALGIYICELMLGRPPFQASDPMKTYTLILKGVDALEIPNRRIGKTATALVKKLCRDNPGERLGSGSGGVNDIRKHRWFMGFDWEGLRSKTLKAPILPKVANAADVTNFDNYPPDVDVPPDEFSGWDEGF